MNFVQKTCSKWNISSTDLDGCYVGLEKIFNWLNLLSSGFRKLGYINLIYVDVSLDMHIGGWEYGEIGKRSK
jgi:hypothetical protein